MRIVYNLRDQNWETTKSLGVLNVSLRILEGLAALPGVDRIDVLANRSLAALLPAHAPAQHVCRFHHLEVPPPCGWARLFWDQWSLVRETNALAPDWLLLPKGFAPLVRWPRTRVSAYVHDNIFAYYRRAGQNPFPLGELALFSRSLAHTVERADLVVTNSAFTAAELKRTYRPRTPPVRVGAPLATAPNVTTTTQGDDILLLVSPWPHKLSRQAIEWLGRWEAETKSHRTVHGIGSLPAEVGWPARPHWQHHRRVSDRELAGLRSRAGILIYFSAYEGYGLPPVEAAAMGLRAIASDLAPLRETMSAGCLFDNTEYLSFRATLDRAMQAEPAAPRIAETARTVAEQWVANLRLRERSG